MGPTLFYATGGLAFMHSNEVIAGNAAGETGFGQGWYTGYVVGAGIEHSFTDRLSAKIEYLFAGGFNSQSGETGTVNKAGDQTFKHEIGDLNIVRAGLNYRLN